MLLYQNLMVLSFVCQWWGVMLDLVRVQCILELAVQVVLLIGEICLVHV
jgi:hypothetical protein